MRLIRFFKSYPLFASIGAIVLATATVLRFAGLSYGLPLSLLGDEFVHVATAFSFFNNHTLVASESFSYVPSLLAVLLAPFFAFYGLLGMGLGWFAGLDGFKEFVLLNTTWFLIGPRILSAFFGLAALPILFMLVRRIANQEAAYISVLFASLDFWLIHESQHGHLWMPMVTLILAAVYALVRISETRERRWYIVSSLAIVLGFWNGFIPIVLSPFLLVAHYFAPSRRFSNLLYSSGILGVLVLLVLYINPVSFLRQFGFAVNYFLEAYGFPALTFLLHNDKVAISMASKAEQLFTILFFDNPVIFVLGIVGLLVFFYRSRFYKALFGVGGVLLYALLFFFMFPAPDARMVLPFIPMLIFGASYLCALLLSYGSRKKIISGMGIVLLAAGLLWSSETSVSYARLLQSPDTRLTAREWIVENVPPHSSILFASKYLDVPRDEQAMRFLADAMPSSLRSVDRYLIEHADRIPTQSYFVLTDGEALGLTPQKTPADFDYFVRSYYVPSSAMRVPEHFKLVQSFYPRSSVKELYDLLQNPVIPLESISEVYNLGPYVEVYLQEK